VEYQAAGLISVVHDSGGPKIDIVTKIDDEPTGELPTPLNQETLLTRPGFHATTASEFAKAFEQALALEDKLAMRLRARESAKRFTEEEFAKRWVVQMEKLVILRQKKELALGAK